MKECSTCKELKEDGCFNKDQSKCKICQLEYVKQWRLNNKEHVDNIKRQYYLKNKEAIKSKVKQYRLNNKDKVRENKKEYRRKNIERIKENDRLYYLQNSEKFKEKSKNRYQNNKEDCLNKTNIRRRKRLYGLSNEQYLDLLEKQNNKCRVCRKELEIPSVDHDHDIGKIRGILCRTCNRAIGLFKDDISVLENAAEYLKLSGSDKRSLSIYQG